MKSKYKNLKFKTEAKFQEWLKEKTDDKLILVDNGQDLQEIWIDEHGEILHCNLQTSIWCGKFVCLSELGNGDNIFMSGINKDNAAFTEMDFILEERVSITAH